MSAKPKRKLPKPTTHVPRDSRLEVLNPAFRAKLELVMDDVERETGARPIVYETLRSSARQRYLWGFGREYDDGRGIVTHSMNADETWHGFALAADLIHPTLEWNAPESWWLALGRAARRHGLRWGADWNDNGTMSDESFIDRPHVQWGAPMRRSPSPRAVLLRVQGGLPAVWREVGAA